MSARSFRLTAVLCAASWLLLGMHAPIVHQFTGHGRVPSAGLLAAMALILVAAVGTLLALLRGAGAGGRPAV